MAQNKKKSEIRKIVTNLDNTDEKYSSMLGSISVSLSDGYWEGDDTWKPFWEYLEFGTDTRDRLTIVIDPDTRFHDSPCIFIPMTDQQVVDYVADCLEWCYNDSTYPFRDYPDAVDLIGDLHSAKAIDKSPKQTVIEWNDFEVDKPNGKYAECLILVECWSSVVDAYVLKVVTDTYSSELKKFFNYNNDYTDHDMIIHKWAYLPDSNMFPDVYEDFNKAHGKNGKKDRKKK